MSSIRSGIRDTLARVRAWLGRLRRRPVPGQTELISVRVEGVVRSKGRGESIFGAQVRYPSGRLSIQTDKDGKFSLTLPLVPKDSSQSFLILFSDYWPNRVRFQASAESIDLGDRCALDPVPGFFRQTTIGVVLSYFGPKLVYIWYSSTRVEKILAGLVLLLLIPPMSLFAIDRGLNIPGTDADEVIREQLQRIHWFPSAHPMVRFKTIRPIYYRGVSYQITPGVYQVDDPEVTIQAGSDVEIEPGTTLRMKKGVQILVKGKLTANGEDGDRKIKFVALDGEAPWGTITLFGEEALDSSLRHCEIRDGSGRAVLGSDTGYFELDAKGQTVGGGLVLFNSTVMVSDTLISNCSAMLGGGVYIRNSPSRPELSGSSPGQVVEIPGSRFTNVHIENCRAEGLSKSAGGAVVIKDAFPEFARCQFNHNHAQGRIPAGAACTWVCLHARFSMIAPSRVTKLRPRAAASTASWWRDYGDENRSGVVVRNCEFLENQARGSGGALSTYNSRIALLSSQFRDNQLLSFVYVDSRIGATGGAVFLDYDTKYTPSTPIVVDHCLFVNNQAYIPPGFSPHEERSFAGGAEHRIEGEDEPIEAAAAGAGIQLQPGLPRFAHGPPRGECVRGMDGHLGSREPIRTHPARRSKCHLHLPERGGSGRPREAAGDRFGTGAAGRLLQ